MDDRKRDDQQHALQVERALLEAIFERIPVMLTLYDPKINMLKLNREFENLIGWKTEDAQDIDLMEEVYPDPDYRKQALEYMQNAGSAWREFRLLTKSGELIDSEWSNIRLDDGTQLGIGIDITERKQAREALEQHRKHLEETVLERTAELAEVNAEQQMILDSVRATIWYKDTENNVLRVNKAAAASVGMKVEDIEGRSLFDLFPKEAERYYKDDLEVIRTGKAKLGIVESLRSSSGEIGWFITDKIPHLDGLGKVTGLIVFAMDITERLKAEDKMEKRSEELRTMVNVMAGRENRMAELKETITKLRAQLEDEGMTPVADDPLIEGRRGKVEE